MPHVITQSCCNDASCVPVCPVNCIHPTPDEPDYATAEMLYIDQDSCIDCGACLDVCPVGAIVADDEVAPHDIRYLDINALFYESGGAQPPVDAPRRRVVTRELASPLRVAIVGSGPAACYAAEELLMRRDVEVEVHMFERLPTPWGLVRFGVAPDHQSTKSVSAQFDRTVSRKGFHLHLNVEVGKHVSHEELQDHHHAVIYAVGASSDRTMGIPGEGLRGSAAGTDFVGWYNGHPDYKNLEFDLDAERVVVIGNGNVALDVARVLVSNVDDLARTDIADHALEALSRSSVREVAVIGRRGPAQAAYTTPELLGLAHLPGVNILADPQEAKLDDVSRAVLRDGGGMAVFKASLAEEYAQRAPAVGGRDIRLRYRLAPVEVLGDARVTGVRLARTELTAIEDGSVGVRQTDTYEEIECGLLLRAIGYRGQPLPGLPFDEARGIVPNAAGRVLDLPTREPRTGVYVTGWIKRGSSGVIGTNRRCAAESVRALIDDLEDGRLLTPQHSADDLSSLLARRQPQALSYDGWRTLDQHEIELGVSRDRPRTKLVDIDEMLDVACGQDRKATMTLA